MPIRCEMNKKNEGGYETRLLYYYCLHLLSVSRNISVLQFKKSPYRFYCVIQSPLIMSLLSLTQHSYIRFSKLDRVERSSSLSQYPMRV